MQDFLKGASYLFRGFKLIQQKGIRHFAYLPMAINTLLFSIAIWVGFSQFDLWIHNMIPAWIPEWVLNWFMWLIWLVFGSILLIVVFFSFSLLANILAAPFNGVLAEAVEDKLTGQKAAEMPWQQLIKDIPVILWQEIHKIGYFLLWAIPLFILSWIPVINIIAPILWIAFSAWFLAVEYHDYPMGNHHLTFPSQRKILRENRMLALGFGLATLGATMIPFVNFLVIPAAVAGATALYLERLK